MITITRLCFGSVLAAVVLALSSASTFAAPLPSTFDADLEDWTAVDRDEGTRVFAQNHAAPTWISSGGAPDGYIETSDFSFGLFYWRAPADVVDDVQLAYGQTLDFYLRSDLQNYIVPEITGLHNIILSAMMPTLVEISYPITPLATPNVWEHFSVPLSETGWSFLAGGSGPVDASEMADVLANLLNLDILAEYGSGFDTGGLDSVSLVVPEPSALMLALVGTVCGAMLRMRRARGLAGLLAWRRALPRRARR